MALIVVVEDEPELSRLIAQSLQEDGHQVEQIHDGDVALERLTGAGQTDPDLIVLDLMLPGTSGLEICRQVRRNTITPIVMLTAKTSELDTVVGLELGADEYLTKPISMRVLQARVAALLRRVEMMRARSTVDDDTDSINHGLLHINPAGREVRVGQESISLTAKEFDLLHLLASNPGRAFSREYLLDRVWGSDFAGFDRTVDTHILRLRRKLGDHEDVAERIATLWGIGYKYDYNPDS